jgi:hypothetical protein
MKDPAKTMTRFRVFTDNIDKETWRANFVLEMGYLKFISHLEAEAIRLKQVCKKILDNHGCE